MCQRRHSGLCSRDSQERNSTAASRRSEPHPEERMSDSIKWDFQFNCVSFSLFALFFVFSESTSFFFSFCSSFLWYGDLPPSSLFFSQYLEICVAEICFLEIGALELCATKADTVEVRL